MESGKVKVGVFVQTRGMIEVSCPVYQTECHFSQHLFIDKYVYSTFKIGCPSYIYVTAHGKELIVEKMELEHTHSCDPELVALYPERRSLSHLGNDDGEDEVRNTS